MRKDEAEKGIRYGATEWAREVGVKRGQSEMPSFNDFVRWMDQKGYSHYFDFRTTEGAMEAAENWFDQELGQAWRN